MCGLLYCAVPLWYIYYTHLVNYLNIANIVFIFFIFIRKEKHFLNKYIIILRSCVSKGPTAKSKECVCVSNCGRDAFHAYEKRVTLSAIKISRMYIRVYTCIVRDCSLLAALEHLLRPTARLCVMLDAHKSCMKLSFFWGGGGPVRECGYIFPLILCFHLIPSSSRFIILFRVYITLYLYTL